MTRLLEIAAIGIGATVGIDLWAVFLRRVAGVRSLDYCLLGRWVLHMRHGVVRHDSIAAATEQPHECKVGWAAHYSIGVAFAFVFIALVSSRWLGRPAFVPALIFGLVTVAVPFVTMQPALGLGIASSRTRNPNAARLKSLSTHAIFGVGLDLSAWLLGHFA